MQEEPTGEGSLEMVSEDDFLSRLRLKVSAEANTVRTDQRASSHNAKRQDFQKVAKRISVPSLDEFKQLCRYFRRDKKLKDLQLICKGLSSGQQYVDAFMDAEGTVYALVGSLTGINTKLQTESLECVINIGLGTESQCLRLCRKAGSYLITSLLSTNSYIQYLCCWAFGNLCGDHPAVCRLLESQEFESAITCGLSSPSSSVAQWSCYALNLYLRTVPHRIGPVCQPELLKRLLAVLSSHQGDVSDCCWCLFVASTVPQVCQSLVNFGVVDASFSVLLGGIQSDTLDVKSATAIIRLLSNCVAIIHELAIEICYRADQFVVIAKYALLSPYIHLQEESCQLVVNLVQAAKSHSVTGVNVLEDSNLKRNLEPILRKALSSKFEECQIPDFRFASQS